MNTVLNSYGQLYGCPEILKKSCKFFCRGLDIRVAEHMEVEIGNSQLFQDFLKTVLQRAWLQIFLFLTCKDISFSVSF